MYIPAPGEYGLIDSVICGGVARHSDDGWKTKQIVVPLSVRIAIVDFLHPEEGGRGRREGRREGGDND